MVRQNDRKDEKMKKTKEEKGENESLAPVFTSPFQSISPCGSVS